MGYEITNEVNTCKWISMGIEIANGLPIAKAYNVSVLQK
jgi:hypothetical protein